VRIVLINLERAAKRRERMAKEFDAVGLTYEIKKAVDGRNLSPSDLAQVDWEARRHLGLRPQDRSSIACWLTHREVMRDLVANGPDMLAIFEDDARIAPEVPEVLNALEAKPISFDLVSLYRRHMNRPFVHGVSLTSGHSIGRVRFSSDRAVGYVITREAARHFLETTPRMVLAIDHALLRFWVSGLNVFYVDPPVVQHGGDEDSQIEGDRRIARSFHRVRDRTALVLCRRLVSGARRAVRRRVAFRKLVRGEIGVTRWSSPVGPRERPRLEDA